MAGFRFITILLLVTVPVIICLDSTDSEEDYAIFYPTVLICVLARNAEPILPYFLGQLENLDYPKDRIRLHIRSDHNTDKTARLLEHWTRDVSSLYDDIDFKFQLSPQSYAEESGPFDWEESRYRNIIALKEEALQKARETEVDYILFLDADQFLVHERILQRLMAQGKTVVAPMMQAPYSNYSNFWAAVDMDGYYRRSELYFELLFYEKLGCTQVPMVHSVFLIDLRAPESGDLTFDPKRLRYYDGRPVDDVLAFAHSAKVAGVQLFVLNAEFYGYLLVPMSPSLGLDDFKEQNLYFLLQIMRDNEMPLLHSPLLPPVYPQMDKVGFDQVYLINLERRPERKLRMQAALRLLGINVTFWNAVDGQALTDQYMQENEISMMPDYQDPYHKRPLTWGEIGCFLSHLSIWHDVVKNGYQKALVFEDDIRFGNYFRPLLDAVNEDLDKTELEWDLIYLGRKQLDKEDEPQITGHRFLTRVAYSYWTLAYMVNARGAAKLLEPKPWKNLVAVDEYLPIMFDQHPNSRWKSYFPQRNLNAFSTDPLLVHPSHYTNEPGYISDTENSVTIQRGDRGHRRGAKDEL